jgi:flavin-dependent dehydrogenase
VVVGGGPAGLAAAIGLAKQAGFRVDVFDARQNPAGDSHSSKEALLVALGERAMLPACLPACLPA